MLVGKGGIYKTTLLGSILPPCLADYYANDSTGNYLDKDMQEAHACKGHICLDAFEATYGKNLSAFKSNMTKESFSIRRPYDKFRSELMHRSSLSGTSNEQHISWRRRFWHRRFRKRRTLTDNLSPSSKK